MALKAMRALQRFPCGGHEGGIDCPVRHPAAAPVDSFAERGGACASCASALPQGALAIGTTQPFSPNRTEQAPRVPGTSIAWSRPRSTKRAGVT